MDKRSAFERLFGIRSKPAAPTSTTHAPIEVNGVQEDTNAAAASGDTDHDPGQSSSYVGTSASASRLPVSSETTSRSPTPALSSSGFYLNLPPPPNQPWRPTWRQVQEIEAAMIEVLEGVLTKQKGRKKKRRGTPGSGRGRVRKTTRMSSRQTLLTYDMASVTPLAGNFSSSRTVPSGSTTPLATHQQPVASGSGSTAAPRPPGRPRRAFQNVNSADPLIPYFSHLKDNSYPEDAESSRRTEAFIESRFAEEYQPWQLTHRVCPRDEGYRCPWTVRPRTLVHAGENCNRRFLAVEMLLKHVERCHFGDSRPFSCRWDGCLNRTFADRTALWQHLHERHIAALLWSCPFQDCRLSSSVPTNRFQSDAHIDKAHDSLYELVRPLGLPRPVQYPRPPRPNYFRQEQSSWSALLPCPRPSTRIRQAIVAASAAVKEDELILAESAGGLLGTADSPQDDRPGCKPWNAILPILDDLEPGAEPLVDLQPTGADFFIDFTQDMPGVEEGYGEAISLAVIPSSRSEQQVVAVSDGEDQAPPPTAHADDWFEMDWSESVVKEDFTFVPTASLQDPHEEDDDELGTPPPPPQGYPVTPKASVNSAVRVVTVKREALIQTDESRHITYPGETTGSSSSGSHRVNRAIMATANSALEWQLSENVSSPAGASRRVILECKEAGVQVGFTPSLERDEQDRFMEKDGREVLQGTPPPPYTT